MKNNRDIVIWGAGGHALVVARTLELMSFNIVGLIDDMTLEKRGKTHYGIEILGGKECLPALKRNGIENIALGFGNCKQKALTATLINDADLSLISAIHPSAQIADNAIIGNGVFIGANVTIDPDCHIGDYAIINNNSCICHNSSIGIACTICPSVAIAGNVTIQSNTWIGIGATVIEQVVIGENVLIGAGSVVTKNVDDNTKAYGVPAKIKKLN